MNLSDSGKVKVLIIDDSALVRDILAKGLERNPGIKVIGTAPDVYIARDMIVRLKPDVLTLDVEMPRMDGVEFLRRLMPQYPLPVVMVSSMTGPGAKVTLDALEYGAVDFVLKPSSSFGNKLDVMMDELCRKIVMASKIQFKNTSFRFSKVIPRKSSDHVLEGSTDKILAIGASTGGTVAIRQLVEGFSPGIPGTVIVQHMPSQFTKMFAERLDKNSQASVKEAEDGDRVLRGRVLIAPGGKQMSLIRSGGFYKVRCRDGEKVNGHCPSVEVLFRSVAAEAGSNAVGVMLTGMGRDGAEGMLELRKAGGRTMAQDEEFSVIFGMPREAYLCGGAEILVPIHRINETISKYFKGMKN